MIMIHKPAGEQQARFAPGDLVEHRRYGYRGVIVAFDPRCRADDAWYEKNQTQPRREQAWYHVLVHGSYHTTYAAEENLQPDPSGEEVHHPLVPQYFSEFRAGRYVRNTTPWDVG